MSLERQFREYSQALDDYRKALSERGLEAIEPMPPVPLTAADIGEESPPESFGYTTGVGLSTRRGPGYLRKMVLKLFFYANRRLVDTLHRGAEYRFSGLVVEAAALSVHETEGRRCDPADEIIRKLQIRNEPIVGGVSIGPLNYRTRGTLGCFVRRDSEGDRGKLYVLSNSHVLSRAGDLAIGTGITQPGWEDLRPAEDLVFARLTHAVPIAFSKGKASVINRVDAAIAVVEDGFDRLAPDRIAVIKRYDPMPGQAVMPGTKVAKCGRSTGYTEGFVDTVQIANVWVDYSNARTTRFALFDQVFRVLGLEGKPFAKVGDSGSVILEYETGRPVGLLFAVNVKDGSAVACHFNAVCNHLGVKPVAV